MEQMIVVYYAQGLLTLTGSAELLKTVKQLNEVLKTFEKFLTLHVCNGWGDQLLWFAQD